MILKRDWQRLGSPHRTNWNWRDFVIAVWKIKKGTIRLRVQSLEIIVEPAEPLSS